MHCREEAKRLCHRNYSSAVVDATWTEFRAPDSKWPGIPQVTATLEATKCPSYAIRRFADRRQGCSPGTFLNPHQALVISRWRYASPIRPSLQLSEAALETSASCRHQNTVRDSSGNAYSGALESRSVSSINNKGDRLRLATTRVPSIHRCRATNCTSSVRPTRMPSLPSVLGR